MLQAALVLLLQILARNLQLRLKAMKVTGMFAALAALLLLSAAQAEMSRAGEQAGPLAEGYYVRVCLRG
jgi:hypothetical protein